MTDTIKISRGLLPCPFCGSPAVAATKKSTRLPSRFKVACSDSGCGAHYGYWHPEVWNHRTLLATPPADAADMGGQAGDVEIPDIVATFDGLYLIPIKMMKAGEHLMTVAQHDMLGN